MSSDEEDIDSIEEEEEEVVVVKKTRRKKKKNQDPNRPKRNMSAFFLYSNAHRERVKQEQPDAKFGDIVSAMCLWCT
jgi:structure-specific recognition protein 1/high mobility group protein B2/high mobility group protein B3